jgi:hypothetical protein
MRKGEGQLRQWLTRAEIRRLARPYFPIVHLSTIMPVGGRGIPRVASSPRFTSIIGRLLGPDTVRRLQERAGFGQTIAPLAVQRTSA